MPDSGNILLNRQYYNFTSVNVSVDGLMIYLSEAIAVEVGTITRFEFKRLELEGEVKVIWVALISDGRTLIGLQYVHLEKNALKKIPRFSQQ